MKVPKNITEFLHWVKNETEKYWQNLSHSEETNNNNWLIGAKWLGLEESKIAEVENKYSISFTFEHKEFLRILHSIDKKRPVNYYDGNDKVYLKEESFFYNWLEDDAEIQKSLSWPLHQLLNDIKSGSWFGVLGNKPPSDLDQELVLKYWFKKAPKLVPIHAHRFVLDVPEKTKNPILSIYGADINIHGWNMKHYLLNELDEYLDIHLPIYDEEEEVWEFELIEEVQEYVNNEWEINQETSIPDWSDLTNGSGSRRLSIK